MKTKIEIKSIFGVLLFSYEKEENTIKDTLKEAIKAGVNLYYADLRNADLSYADLRYADLSNADLRNANLRYADLSNADLSNADLSNADLRNADLRNADLSNADLSNADLRNADLSNADLSNADLSNANLRYADLSNADLSNADLSNADLRNADLRYADLGDWGSLQFCTDVLFISPIGSRNGCTIFFKTNKGIFVKCGCFKGTIEVFANKVRETHGGNEHAKDYLALVEFVKVKYNVDK